MATPPLTRRQRQILEFFEAFIARSGISPTLEEVANEFGVNKVTIFGHVAELEKKGVLSRAARGVSRGLQIVHPVPRASIKVPILGRIAAGRPLDAVETADELDLQDLLPPGLDVYALSVRGDSMIGDSICDGDLVLVERRTDPANGEIVVAILADEGATLKRFYRERDRIRLQPANPTMLPIYVDEVEVRGVVIGVLRRYGAAAERSRR